MGSSYSALTGVHRIDAARKASGREVWFVDGERSTRDEETRATQCRVVRERRRTSAILRNRNIAKNPGKKTKVEENKQTNKNVSWWQIAKTVFAHVCPVLVVPTTSCSGGRWCLMPRFGFSRTLLWRIGGIQQLI